MKTVILCGGRGTRMGRTNVPKPLVEIGDKPILWHIMKFYSHYGYRDFVLCLGHLGEKIFEYFTSETEMPDNEATIHYQREGWSITFVDTGLERNTGGRIKMVEHLLNDTFFATYGDGLSDMNLNSLLEFHNKHGNIATLTSVRARTTFGTLELDSNRVADFVEKPVLEEWINGGFFVFEPEVFEHIGENDVLEREVFHRLVEEGALMAYKYTGFWDCMDTYKENIQLNEMWRDGEAKWAVWK